MSNNLRVFRGIIGSAAVWALAAIPLTAAFVAIEWAFGAPIPSSDFLGKYVALQCFGGAINGAAFGVMMALFARRQTISALRFRRVALLGGAAGLLAPMISIGIMLSYTVKAPISVVSSLSLQFALSVLVGGALGAGLATGSLRLARRMPDSAQVEVRDDARIAAT